MEQRVQIITTGGTIASLKQENGDVSAALSGEQLIERLGISDDVLIQSSVTLGSYAFDYQTLYTVAKNVIEALKSPEVAGVVVTHGTDTMEETAFYLSLVTRQFKKPVILTGAQLNASETFSDGPKNLKDAIRAAKSEELAEAGALIVFAGFIHTARDVRKIDTNALEAFQSPGWGPIGRVDEHKVIVARKVYPRPSLKPEVPERVALIRLGIGMTGEEFRQMADGYPGVVIEAYGRGNCHPTIPAEAGRLVADGIPVVVTSRCPGGEVLPVYGAGGGKDLQRAGAWFAGDLAGEKARVLLGTMLANDLGWDEMKRIIQEFSQP